MRQLKKNTNNMRNEKYNGWTNYETWNAALWLDNDYGSKTYWSETAQEVFENSEADSTFTRKENAAYILADQIEESFENDAADKEKVLEKAGYGSTWTNDAINCYLGEIDWYEIAEHFLSEVE